LFISKRFRAFKVIHSFGNDSGEFIDLKYLEANVVACIEKTNKEKSMIKLRNFKGDRLRTIEFNSSSLFYSRQHKLLVAAGLESEILLCKIDIEYLNEAVTIQVKTEAPIKGFDMLSSGLLAAMSKRNVSLWMYEPNNNKLSLAKELKYPFDDDEFVFVQALPDEKIAIGLASSKIFIYNKEFVRIQVFEAHEKKLTGLIYDPINERLISLSSGENLVKLWDLNGACLKEIRLRRNEHTPSSLSMLGLMHFGVTCDSISGNKIEIYNAYEMEFLKNINSSQLHMSFFGLPDKKGFEFVDGFLYIFNFESFKVIAID